MALVGIDAIHVSRRGKGISRLQHSLIDAVAAEPRGHRFQVFVNGREDLPELPSVPHVRYVRVHPPNLLTWELFQLPMLARRHRLALVQTMSDRLPLWGGVSFLMFLSEVPDYRWDMARANGSLYQRASDGVTRLLFKRSLARAAVIVVPSQFTRSDLLQKYPVSPAKVRVVREAAGPQFTPGRRDSELEEIRSRYRAPGGYVLHFSSHNDPRDNTITVLRTFREIARAARVQLVIAGELGKSRDELVAKARELGIGERIRLIGYVPDEELPALYRCAAVYFDPSLYEGFGLQALEAMACGTPIVCSNTTSLPELVGDAAITCSPTDSQAFAAALGRVLSNPELARSMRAKGLDRAAQYSWQKTAAGLVALYEEVLT